MRTTKGDGCCLHRHHCGGSFTHSLSREMCTLCPCVFVMRGWHRLGFRAKDIERWGPCLHRHARWSVAHSPSTTKTCSLCARPRGKAANVGQTHTYPDSPCLRRRQQLAAHKLSHKRSECGQVLGPSQRVGGPLCSPAFLLPLDAEAYLHSAVHRRASARCVYFTLQCTTSGIESIP